LMIVDGFFLIGIVLGVTWIVYDVICEFKRQRGVS